MQLRHLSIFFSLLFILISMLLYKSIENLITYSIATTSIYIKFLSISLFACSFFELIKNIFSKKDEKIVIAKNIKKFSILIILLIGYVCIMGYLGFIISSLIFLISTMWLMGYKKIIQILITSSIIVAFVYILFSVIFKIPLPELIILEGLLWR
ncbi:tripartite tricarboxylate transport protein TctABC, membrane-spanning subunit TctB [Campylobacter blaseri]|uniref:DUF1468 domain-containing protein n=1 Tax=Campylobacter blaseri TaxID=2042961 RepID=A0A2P8R238_9BACT|nr:tripartite tricarboxylate transporter TctB family protein [Campylobacter blaseri]PSM52561.1 hypothetical protein CQ405_02200 [Campylobacter blaseri]PSM54209.1 hypothetical protein CRN67_02200 [Campylobacter blaseri]QKF85860.1 tripartite tricarboxylate transport protein TctABC, membrane-spanning subunit TctB [Campylobacter blaseri]